jgi:hypothetical protein
MPSDCVTVENAGPLRSVKFAGALAVTVCVTGVEAAGSALTEAGAEFAIAEETRMAPESDGFTLVGADVCEGAVSAGGVGVSDAFRSPP